MYGVFILHQTPPAEIKDRPSQGGIHALKAKCPPHCMLMKHNEWPHGPRTCSQIIAPLIPHKLMQTPHKSLRVETGSCQLAAGTCEIVTLDRDSSQPRRTIARQTARCACKKGQIAGTTRARPACVDVLNIEAGEIEDSQPSSPAYEDLFDVVSREVAKLNIKWPQK
ncbi:Protein FAM19A5 [Anabarilius grahami]|uniref:Protein FAM19A5 n=1 Tax=Anabarilius grahami TaxID=495550 RepID=A0A3N0XU48_ANAGA|nr:Protein FAM19A5 [Anabarilius grahami]